MPPFDSELLKRYDRPGPRYTSYPTTSIAMCNRRVPLRNGRVSRRSCRKGENHAPHSSHSGRDQGSRGELPPGATAVEYDYPAHDAIVRRAFLIKADLIVAGSPADRHAAAGLLRLTDWELLRHSPVPVLLVKRSRPYRHPNVLVAVDPCHAHSKPSQLDEEILGVGGAIAAALHGKLHAIHAYAPVVIGSAAGSVPAGVAVRLENRPSRQLRPGAFSALEAARGIRSPEPPSAAARARVQPPARRATALSTIRPECNSCSA